MATTAMVRYGVGCKDSGSLPAHYLFMESSHFKITHLFIHSSCLSLSLHITSINPSDPPPPPTPLTPPSPPLHPHPPFTLTPPSPPSPRRHEYGRQPPPQQPQPLHLLQHPRPLPRAVTVQYHGLHHRDHHLCAATVLPRWVNII